MFAMPILLAIVITSVQNSTFELVNENKIPLLIYNKDKGESGKELVNVLQKIGMFDMQQITGEQNEKDVKDRMHAKDALVAIVIPDNYSTEVLRKAKNVTREA
jgi:ABC-2 type transport system permease protein